MEVKVKEKQIKEKYIEIKVEKEDLDKIDEIIEKVKHKAMRIYNPYLLCKLNEIPKELSPTAKLYMLSRWVEIISNSINTNEIRENGKQELFLYYYKNDPFFAIDYHKTLDMMEKLCKHTKHAVKYELEKWKAKK